MLHNPMTGRLDNRTPLQTRGDGFLEGTAWHHRKIRAICGVNLRDGDHTAEPREWLGAKDVEALEERWGAQASGTHRRAAARPTPENHDAGRSGTFRTSRKRRRGDLACTSAALEALADRERWRETVAADPAPEPRTAPRAARAMRTRAGGRCPHCERGERRKRLPLRDRRLPPGGGGRQNTPRAEHGP
jgi:hypothetical protein